MYSLVSRPAPAASERLVYEDQPWSKLKPWIDPSFVVPETATGYEFKLVRFRPALAKADHDAYIANTDHIRKHFNVVAPDWPTGWETMEYARNDMEMKEEMWNRREAFDYSLQTLNGDEVLGAVYIRPGGVGYGSYAATVTYWVNENMYKIEFHEALVRWLRSWIYFRWPLPKDGVMIIPEFDYSTRPQPEQWDTIEVHNYIGIDETPEESQKRRDAFWNSVRAYPE